MIAIVDYGVGNLFSLQSALTYIGVETVLTSDASRIANAHKIILPGVGAFKDAAQKLFDSGLADVVINQAKQGKHLLGICLGMQLLFSESHEYGVHKGLNLISGKVLPMENTIDNKSLKIPHIGWNPLTIMNNDEIFKHIQSGEQVYYVHSYAAQHCESSTLATSEYGMTVTGVVKSNNVYGMQFHPEKSGATGLALLKGFAELR